MKKILLISMVFIAGSLAKAQTIQLPGVGSNNITIASSDISAASQLIFGNPEYNVIGFTVKFSTNTNPSYSANSSDNHFTPDMLANLALITGSNVDLQVSLKAPGEGHEVWQKTYVMQLSH